MSGTITRNVAVTWPSQDAPCLDAKKDIAADENIHIAVSCSPAFDAVRSMLEESRPPRRPNRNRPVVDVEVDPGLRDELDAWDAASNEALERFEGRLSE